MMDEAMGDTAEINRVLDKEAYRMNDVTGSLEIKFLKMILVD